MSEMRVPYISRDHRSRPCTSVPSTKIVWAASRPGSTPIRWRVMGITPRKWYSKPWAKKRMGIFWLGSGR